MEMQAVVNLTQLRTSLITHKSVALPLKFIPTARTSQRLQLKATSVMQNDPLSVDYSSVNSVFPAEACETVGGEACEVEMYPEVKLKPEMKTPSTNSAELTDRDYLEYDSPKTVFPGEACDDLGGEFCEPEYQRGVY